MLPKKKRPLPVAVIDNHKRLKEPHIEREALPVFWIKGSVRPLVEGSVSVGDLWISLRNGKTRYYLCSGGNKRELTAAPPAKVMRAYNTALCQFVDRVAINLPGTEIMEMAMSLAECIIRNQDLFGWIDIRTLRYGSLYLPMFPPEMRWLIVRSVFKDANINPHGIDENKRTLGEKLYAWATERLPRSK